MIQVYAPSKAAYKFQAKQLINSRQIFLV